DLLFNDNIYASRPDNFGKDEIQIIFNLNQKIDWQIDQGREKVSMLPGQVCVFRNNNYETSINYDGQVKFQFKSLQMTTSYFEELLSKYFSNTDIEMGKSLFLTHVTSTEITADMYRVLSEIDSAEKYHEFKGVFLEAKMIELIALVLHGIFYNRSTSIERKLEITEGNEADKAQLEKLRRRIQFNPADDYKTPQLAKNLSMSESKLTRLFRSLYGTSIHRYVQDQRLERAASLILDQGLNVSEAALQSGYTNMSWFSKEFQKKFGVTPKKFSMGK
ncbi:MAG: AraC family transcriptional regulator, partial [Treponema sp.]|nr:AraC family transcriptional regulator [Treponema sp.]